jgi:Zn-dependent peptidase ImmA (M78 family)/plasmid maintenance system antidote protein VapI
LTDTHEFTPDWFSKPGDSLRALMQRRGVTAASVSDRLPGGLVALRGLLDGSRAIDSEEAATLATTVGGSSSFWLKRQINYDRALERAVDRAVATEADDWLLIPVPGARPRGRMSEDTRRAEVRRRLAFFNVGTIAAWETRYGRVRSETLFRTSEVFTSDDRAVLMWLREGELGADIISTQPLHVENLLDRLDTIRKLSLVRRPELFLPKLKALCAEVGVAVVLQRAPQGCRASGASRMVASDKAMILLSFRGLSDDRFWFTVFHELGHVVLHRAQTFVDSDINAEEEDETEREANEFASRCIIPERREEDFERLHAAKDAVVRFSVSAGVSPGLTVGQMQHRRMIRPNQMNYLKRHWRWDDLADLFD